MLQGDNFSDPKFPPSDLSKFCVETEKGIFDAILKEEVDFVSQPWPSISNSGKDLVSKMLTKDPKKRITSSEVLGNMLSCFLE